MRLMKPPRGVLSVLIGICFLAACNSTGPNTGSEPSVAQLAATIAAATINASQAGTTSAALTPLAPAVTPTTRPTLFIHADNASCRTGPGPDFKVLTTFAAGTTVDMAGKDSANSYWIVVDPGSHSLCWIQAQDATPAGSFDLLPEMTAQPISVSAPGKPSRGAWNFSCDNTTLTTILAWNATTGTANGFRVFRQESQIADLPATQTTYTDKIPFRYGSSMTYSVAAYNDAGTSPPVVWNFHCP